MKAPEIKQTTDYKIFSSIIGNRNVSPKKIEKISADIKRGFNLLPFCPIIVYKEDNSLMIVDGQHRYHVAVEMELPVYYVEAEKLDLKDIALLNSRQDKWTQYDFLKCYIKLGIKDYEILKDVLDEFNIGLSTTYEFLMVNDGVSRQHGVSEKFKTGEFKVNYLEETKELFTLTLELFDRYNFYKDRYLIAAVQKIMAAGMCDFEVLKEKIKQDPNSMDKQTSTKNYIYNIERVYNFKNSIRKTIF